MIEARERHSCSLATCLALACALFAGHAALAMRPADCPAGANARMVAELVFGRNIGPVLGVGELEFGAFVDGEVTPRFPGGFTILDGQGQYRGKGETAIVREPSKVLVVALADVASGREKLAAIAATYTSRFRQQSVLTILRPACVSF